jgi:hypothetical protein
MKRKSFWLSSFKYYAAAAERARIKTRRMTRGGAGAIVGLRWRGYWRGKGWSRMSQTPMRRAINTLYRDRRGYKLNHVRVSGRFGRPQVGRSSSSHKSPRRGIISQMMITGTAPSSITLRGAYPSICWKTTFHLARRAITMDRLCLNSTRNANSNASSWYRRPGGWLRRRGRPPGTPSLSGRGKWS